MKIVASILKVKYKSISNLVWSTARVIIDPPLHLRSVCNPLNSISLHLSRIGLLVGFIEVQLLSTLTGTGVAT